MKKISLAIILLVALVGGVYIYVLQSGTQLGPEPAAIGTLDHSEALPAATSSTISGTHVTPEVISASSPPPEGYIEYRNKKYGFSFYYAPEGKVKEYDEGGGAMTVVLENFARVRGMQIFIVPYAEATISEERFHKDVPSGVRIDPQNATLDGVRAVTFVSEDQFLGETREIWVIRDGYLYEITTFRGVGNWFAPIIQSWRFF